MMTIMITKEDIEKLATLSRIHLSEEEKESFAGEIDSILEYVRQVQSIVGDVSDEERQTAAVKNVMREDGEPHESGMYTKALLSEVPKREGDYVKVKKILP